MAGELSVTRIYEAAEGRGRGIVGARPAPLLKNENATREQGWKPWRKDGKPAMRDTLHFAPSPSRAECISLARVMKLDRCTLSAKRWRRILDSVTRMTDIKIEE